LKNVLLLIFICLFASCEIVENNSSRKTENRNDSILIYYRISGDATLPLDRRQQAINKSLFLSKDSIKDTLYNRILYQKNLLHFSLNQYDSLYIFNNRLLNFASQKEDNSILARQHYLMGYYFNEIAQISDSAFRNYNLSKYYFNQINDSSWVGKNLLNMSAIQKDKNDFFGSKETITEAIKYLTSERDKEQISSSYNILATNHRKLLNNDDALKYYFKAIEATNSQKDRLIYQNNIAVTYIDKKQYYDAITLLNKIVRDTVLIQNKKEYARVLDNLAYALWLADARNNELEFLKPLQLRKQNKDLRGQLASYTHLGEFYSKTNITKATFYFDSVIQVSKSLKIPRAEKDALKFLMILEPNNVNLRDRYVFLQDSLYEQETKVKTQFAKYKYDDRLKQESILRLEKDNTEKELEASQQRNQKIIYLGGFLFISSVLGLSLYGFKQRTKRLKQKSKIEKLAAIQEIESELSQKLHDDHGGKLNQVMLLIQRGADKEVVLNKIEELYNNTRDFSRSLNSVDTGPDYWKSLKATMEYTKPTKVEMVLNGGKELNWSLISHQTKAILFKVLQELVINMTRHSKAKQTVILFKDQNKELFVYYEDDGVGASEESLLRKNGLQNTEKRIQAIGGSITFESEEGNGFRADIRIPK